jgi:hypothetical protein
MPSLATLPLMFVLLALASVDPYSQVMPSAATLLLMSVLLTFTSIDKENDLYRLGKSKKRTCTL